MNKKTFILGFSAALILIVLVGARMFYGEKLGLFLQEAKNMLLSGVALVMPERAEEPAETLRVDLSDIFTEEPGLEIVGFKPETLEEKPGVSVEPAVLGQSTRQMTLGEIGAEVERIRQEKEVIAEKVAVLVAAHEQKAGKIVGIQAKIQEINKQIDSLSQQMADLVSV